MLKVEVVYLGDKQTLLSLEVEKGSTVLDVLKRSGLESLHPECEIFSMPVGIFSQRVSLETLVQDGDRIELYRPLTITPMEKRRLLASQKEKKKK
jgi:uncharacterized protein